MKLKKDIYLLFVMLIAAISINYAQELTQQEKQAIIDSLDSNSSVEEFNARIQIKKYKITEAIPKLESKAKNGDCTGEYLRLLEILGSTKTQDLAHVAIDSANQCYDPIETRYNATEVLIKLGDYSTAEYILEFYNSNHRLINLWFDVTLLPKIIDNRPDLKQQAKDILFDYIEKKKGSGFSRLIARAIVIEKFPEESAPILVNSFRNEKDDASRILSLKYLFMINYPQLPALMRERLQEEPIPSYRTIIVDSLLNNFGNIENYEFVKNYLANESDTVSKVLISNKLKRFKPTKPDSNSNVSPSTMLDTLTSYTNQCYGYEWLKDEAYKNELLNKLINAKNMLDAGDSLGCRTEVAAFQNSVNQVYQDSAGSYPKYVSKEGYKFLYYYAGYILDRLPENKNIRLKE